MRDSTEDQRCRFRLRRLGEASPRARSGQRKGRQAEAALVEAAPPGPYETVEEAGQRVLLGPVGAGRLAHLVERLFGQVLDRRLDVQVVAALLEGQHDGLLPLSRGRSVGPLRRSGPAAPARSARGGAARRVEVGRRLAPLPGDLRTLASAVRSSHRDVRVLAAAAGPRLAPVVSPARVRLPPPLARLLELRPRDPVVDPLERDGEEGHEASLVVLPARHEIRHPLVQRREELAVQVNVRRLEGADDDPLERVGQRERPEAVARAQASQLRVATERLEAVGLDRVQDPDARAVGRLHDEVHERRPRVAGLAPLVDDLLELVEPHDEPRVAERGFQRLDGELRPQVLPRARKGLDTLLHLVTLDPTVAREGLERAAVEHEEHVAVLGPVPAVGQEVARRDHKAVVVVLRRPAWVAEVADQAGAQEGRLADAAPRDDAERRRLRRVPDPHQVGQGELAVLLAPEEDVGVLDVVRRERLERVGELVRLGDPERAAQEGPDLSGKGVVRGQGRVASLGPQVAEEVAELEELEAVSGALPPPEPGVVLLLEKGRGCLVEVPPVPPLGVLDRLRIDHVGGRDEDDLDRGIAGAFAAPAALVRVQRGQALEDGAREREAAVLGHPHRLIVRRRPGMDQPWDAFGPGLGVTAQTVGRDTAERGADPLAEDAHHGAAHRVGGRGDLRLRRLPVVEALAPELRRPVVGLDAVVAGGAPRQLVQDPDRRLAEPVDVARRGDEDGRMVELGKGPHGTVIVTRVRAYAQAPAATRSATIRGGRRDSQPTGDGCRDPRRTGEGCVTTGLPRRPLPPASPGRRSAGRPCGPRCGRSS